MEEGTLVAGIYPFHKPTALAEFPGLGGVFRCDFCGHVHLSIGPISIVLTRETYFQLVAMLNSSAANFEAQMEREQDRGCHDGIRTVSKLICKTRIPAVNCGRSLRGFSDRQPKGLANISF
jgi:hypothetical protein